MEMRSGHKALSVVILVSVFGAVGCWWLCRGYPEVSPKTYELSKALYSACLTQDEERLAKVEQLLELAGPKGLPTRERGWLAQIIRRARNNDWQSAAQKARKIMEDQVRY